jgi:hypothetical protein
MDMKKKTLPKGFLSRMGEPTTNAVHMYHVYLSTLPKGWNINKMHPESVQRVRKYFGVDYGFDAMIRWGIEHGCCNSKTSSGRHSSMSKALVLAQTLIGAGVRLPDVRLVA